MTAAIDDTLPLLYYGITPLLRPMAHPSAYKLFLPWNHPRFDPAAPSARVPRSNVPRDLMDGLPRHWTFTPEELVFATSIPMRGQLEITVFPSRSDASGMPAEAPPPGAAHVPVARRWHLLQVLGYADRGGRVPVAGIEIGDCNRHQVRASLTVDEAEYEAAVDSVEQTIVEAFLQVGERLAKSELPTRRWTEERLQRDRDDALSFHGPCLFVALLGTGRQVVV